ncbi:MAG: ABC transporter substrate-binding protein [Chloroflexota bacterium]|nr:ABC transporter substrate-binding protein [Chloroflexota bacterium]
MKRTSMIVVLFVIVLAAFGAFGVGAQDEPIKIGIAVAQTSNVALLGQEQVIGAEIAEAFFNERGGINGRMIELVYRDTAGDEAGAINAFQQVISEDVVGIVGPTLSQQAFASDPIANEAGVPVLAPSNTARGIPEIGEYIARVSSPVAIVAPNAVSAALNINPDIQTVAVFYAQNDAFASSETSTFQTTVTEMGLTLLEVQTFQTTDTDFSAQITNALAGNPDLAIVSGLAADGGNLINQLRQFGYTGLIIGGNGLNTANVYPVCQAQCDGIIIAQAYSYAADTEINKAFRDIYFEAQGKEPPQFSAQAFTGVQVFVEALIALDNEVGLDTLELADLRTQLNTTLLGLSYDTPLGTISFTPDGEIIQAEFYVAQIEMNDDGQTGRFVFIPTGNEDEMMEATPEATASS